MLPSHEVSDSDARVSIGGLRPRGLGHIVVSDIWRSPSPTQTYIEVSDTEVSDTEVSDIEVSDIEVSDAEISDPEVSDTEVADSQRDVGHAWMYLGHRGLGRRGLGHIVVSDIWRSPTQT